MKLYKLFPIFAAAFFPACVQSGIDVKVSATERFSLSSGAMIFVENSIFEREGFLLNGERGSETIKREIVPVNLFLDGTNISAKSGSKSNCTDISLCDAYPRNYVVDLDGKVYTGLQFLENISDYGTNSRQVIPQISRLSSSWLKYVGDQGLTVFEKIDKNYLGVDCLRSILSERSLIFARDDFVVSNDRRLEVECRNSLAIRPNISRDLRDSMKSFVEEGKLIEICDLEISNNEIRYILGVRDGVAEGYDKFIIVSNLGTENIVLEVDKDWPKPLGIVQPVIFFGKGGSAILESVSILNNGNNNVLRIIYSKLHEGRINRVGIELELQ